MAFNEALGKEPVREPVARDILPLEEARRLVSAEYPDDKIHEAHTDSAIIAGIAVFEFWTRDPEGCFQTRFVTRRDDVNARAQVHSQFSGLASYVNSAITRERNAKDSWSDQPQMVKFALFFVAILLFAIAAIAIYSKQTTLLLLAFAAMFFVVIYVVGQIGGHDKIGISISSVIRIFGLGK
jgi:hypothetical protein